MKLRNLSLAILLAGLGGSATHAQDAERIAQEKAMQVLQEIMAGQRKEKAPAALQPTQTGRTNAPAAQETMPPASTNAPAPEPQPMTPELTEAQRRAMEMLNRLKAEGRERTNAPAAAQRKTVKNSKPSKKPGASAASKESPASSGITATNASATITLAPAGPQTKDERLKQLLKDYLDDKITPEQYHEQRAKILKEPEASSK